MIDLEKIKARRACQPDAWAFLGYAPATIDTLVEEVERLQQAWAECNARCAAADSDAETAIEQADQLEAEAERLQRALELCEVGLAPSDVEEADDDLQPCGHPQSAIVTAGDLGGNGTNYCGMCEEKVAKQYADEAMMEQQVEEEEREGEYGG